MTTTPITYSEHRAMALDLVAEAEALEAHGELVRRTALARAKRLRAVAAKLASRPKSDDDAPVSVRVVRTSKMRLRATWGELGAYADFVGPIDASKLQMVAIYRDGSCEARGDLREGKISLSDARGRQATPVGQRIEEALAREVMAFLERETTGDDATDDSLH